VRERRNGEKNGNEGNGRDRPPLRKFLDPPSVECGLSAGHRVIIPVENMIFCAFQKARSKSKLGVVVGPARCICNHGQSLRSSTIARDYIYSSGAHNHTQFGFRSGFLKRTKNHVFNWNYNSMACSKSIFHTGRIQEFAKGGRSLPLPSSLLFIFLSLLPPLPVSLRSRAP